MSSRKRPLVEISSSSQRTPRQAPSTPHARRAFEQRSAAKQRSVKSRKTLNNLAQPLSVGGILRRLAKATAPFTKAAAATPVNNKENVDSDEEDKESSDAQISPRLLLHDGDEEYGEDDSEIPAAPTPSVLPDDGDPTMTFKSIDFARSPRPASEKPRRSSARVSFAPHVDDREDDDDTILTAEMGRRALSEGPVDRYSRNSFGSIRMSDFEFDVKKRRISSNMDTSRFMDDDYMPMGMDDDMDVTQGGETQDLRRLQRSPSRASEHDLSLQIGGEQEDDDTFHLQMPEVSHEVVPKPTPLPSQQISQAEDDQDSDFEDLGADDDANAQVDFQPRQPAFTRRQTPMEIAASGSRKKKLKLTRHGAVIPSLPASLMKRIAIDARTRVGKRKPTLGRDHVKALEQATEWFFAQVGEDLETFSAHARRKKRVDGSDVLTLMRRQRVLRGDGEMTDLAKEWLPRKVLEELDLPDHI